VQGKQEGRYHLVKSISNDTFLAPQGQYVGMVDAAGHHGCVYAPVVVLRLDVVGHDCAEEGLVERDDGRQGGEQTSDVGLRQYAPLAQGLEEQLHRKGKETRGEGEFWVSHCVCVEGGKEGNSCVKGVVRSVVLPSW